MTLGQWSLVTIHKMGILVPIFLIKLFWGGSGVILGKLKQLPSAWLVARDHLIPSQQYLARWWMPSRHVTATQSPILLPHHSLFFSFSEEHCASLCPTEFLSHTHLMVDEVSYLPVLSNNIVSSFAYVYYIERVLTKTDPVYFWPFFPN